MPEERVKALFIGGLCDGKLQIFERRVASVTVSSTQPDMEKVEFKTNTQFDLKLQRWDNVRVTETYYYRCSIGPFLLYVHEGYNDDPLESIIKVYTASSGL